MNNQSAQTNNSVNNNSGIVTNQNNITNNYYSDSSSPENNRKSKRKKIWKLVVAIGVIISIIAGGIAIWDWLNKFQINSNTTLNAIESGPKKSLPTIVTDTSLVDSSIRISASGIDKNKKTEKTILKTKVKEMDSIESGTEEIIITPAVSEIKIQDTNKVKTIYVESTEDDIFGKRINFTSNRLKSKLIESHYRITENLSKADYKLDIIASTRKFGDTLSTIAFYADVSIKIINIHEDEIVYQNEFSSERKTCMDYEGTRRKVYEEAIIPIVDKIEEKVKNLIPKK